MFATRGFMPLCSSIRARRLLRAESARRVFHRCFPGRNGRGCKPGIIRVSSASVASGTPSGRSRSSTMASVMAEAGRSRRSPNCSCNRWNSAAKNSSGWLAAAAWRNSRQPARRARSICALAAQARVGGEPFLLAASQQQGQPRGDGNALRGEEPWPGDQWRLNLRDDAEARFDGARCPAGRGDYRWRCSPRPGLGGGSDAALGRTMSGTAGWVRVR